MESYNLLKVNEYIKQVISLNFAESIWVDAEISQIKEVRGQVYIDFVEKNSGNDSVVAKAQGVIWFKSLLFVKKKLGELYESIMQEGMQVRFRAIVEYHEVYGLKFSLEDVDATFTLGQIEINRQKSISKLQNEGLIGKNQLTSLPVALKKIAVISSEKAAGFKDFIHHLENNSFGYKFAISFFDSSMQGNTVEKEMVRNLEKINANYRRFDCVIIIRGGGSKMDLSYFDSYEISKAVANFPIPVLTGIGHEIDKNVIELVAHSPLKTPTAVADFIIHHNLNFESEILGLFDDISVFIRKNKNENSLILNNFISKILFNSRSFISEKNFNLGTLKEKIKNETDKQVFKEKIKITEVENKIRLLNPVLLLEMGYSMTTIAGKLIKSVHEVQKNELITTHLTDGCFESKVI
jgi:exodeoxyribonuclease VII large subunit